MRKILNVETSKKLPMNVVMLSICLIILILYVRGEPQIDSNAGNILRVGFSDDMFTDVDIKDAQMALDIWMKKLTRDAGETFSVESIIFTDLEDMIAAIHALEVDMVQIGAIDYIEVLESLPLTPVISPGTVDSPLESLVLLAHKDTQTKGLEQLENKVVIIESGRRNRTSYLWLNYELAKVGMEEVDSYFQMIKNEQKPGKIVHPVFFKQADACVISKRAFQTMTELNPQVGRDLVVLSESPEFPNYISCFRDDFDHAIQERIKKTAFEMHFTPEGKQILTLFHIERALPFEPSHLENLRNLIDEYKRITKDRANGKSKR